MYQCRMTARYALFPTATVRQINVRQIVRRFVTAPDEPGAILAIAVCDADGGDIRVTYFQYTNHESMFSAYSGFRIASQIEPDSGDCDDPATWPTENAYDIGDVASATAAWRAVRTTRFPGGASIQPSATSRTPITSTL